MKTQYRVINRENRNEYTLNAEELSKFFKKQLIRDYAISRIPSKKETWLGLSCLGLAFIICITKIITQWL